MYSLYFDCCSLIYCHMNLFKCSVNVYKSNHWLWCQMLLPIAVEDVKREVKILQALAGHENVVQFHNVFEDDSYVYIVME